MIQSYQVLLRHFQIHALGCPQHETVTNNEKITHLHELFCIILHIEDLLLHLLRCDNSTVFWKLVRSVRFHTEWIPMVSYLVREWKLKMRLLTFNLQLLLAAYFSRVLWSSPYCFSVVASWRSVESGWGSVRGYPTSVLRIRQNMAKLWVPRAKANEMRWNQSPTWTTATATLCYTQQCRAQRVLKIVAP